MLQPISSFDPRSKRRINERIFEGASIKHEESQEINKDAYVRMST